jgi:hypothetical protein
MGDLMLRRLGRGRSSTGFHAESAVFLQRHDKSSQ